MLDLLQGEGREEELGLFPWLCPPCHCLSHSSYFPIDCYFEYVPSKGKRLWLALDGDGTVYCTGAKQQQKKKMEKKRHKKEKKSQFGDGTICSLEAPDPFRSIVSFKCV